MHLIENALIATAAAVLSRQTLCFVYMLITQSNPDWLLHFYPRYLPFLFFFHILEGKKERQRRYFWI